MNEQILRSFKFLCLLLIALLIAAFFVNVTDSSGGVIHVEADSVDPLTFRDYTIFSGDGTVEAIDGDHNTIWSVPFRALDKEMLPNGNR